MSALKVSRPNKQLERNLENSGFASVSKSTQLKRLPAQLANVADEPQLRLIRNTLIRVQDAGRRSIRRGVGLE